MGTTTRSKSDAVIMGLDQFFGTRICVCVSGTPFPGRMKKTWAAWICVTVWGFPLPQVGTTASNLRWETSQAHQPPNSAHVKIALHIVLRAVLRSRRDRNSSLWPGLESQKCIFTVHELLMWKTQSTILLPLLRVQAIPGCVLGKIF